MTELRNMLDAARAHALQTGLPARRKDAALYALLASCLAICEKVQSEGLEPELRAALKVSVDERNPEIWGQGRSAGNAGKGKRYAEKTSDAYVLVCRYVMEGRENYATRSRYATSLREAGRRKIHSAELVEWLTKNGGVHKLFMTRPVEAVVIERRTLHLNQAVKFRKGESFTLQLRYDGEGFFDVIG
jgi:hypothetical protein